MSNFFLQHDNRMPQYLTRRFYIWAMLGALLTVLANILIVALMVATLIITTVTCLQFMGVL